MTVQAIEADITYTFNDEGQYPFAFDILKPNDVTVQFIDNLGVRHGLAMGTDYLVVDNAGSRYIEIISTCGFIGQPGQLFIFRDMPVEQPTNWVNNEELDMELLEKSFDRVIMILQQFNTQMTSELAAITWRDGWKTGIVYEIRDLVQAPNTNIYLATVGHTAGVFEDDLLAGKWNLVIDISEIAGYASAAGVAQIAAEAAATLANQHLTDAEAVFQNTVAAQAQAEVAMNSAIASATYAAASADALPNTVAIGANNVPQVNSNANGWIPMPLGTTGREVAAGETATAIKTTLGLGNVDNTSDLDKPISTATQQAINAIAGLSQSPLPIGTVVPYIGGYFTDSANGGFVAVHGNNAASINARYNILGMYVCDGAELNVPGSAFFDGPGRHLPNLTDDRFIMGSSSAGVFGGLNETTHLHEFIHTHGITHTHGMAHTHTMAHVHWVHDVTLSWNQMPYHAHTHHNEVWANVSGSSYRTSRSSGNWCNSVGHGGRGHIDTYPAGGDGAHSHGNTAGSSAANTGGSSAANTGGASVAKSGNPSANNTANITLDNRPKFISCLYLMKAV